jgi:ribosomal protein S18 acetylase RimI-like enzyme
MTQFLMTQFLLIRDVTPADLDALTALRPPRALHAERVATSPDEGKSYLLAQLAGRAVGFGVIYFRGDPMWDRPDQVPLIMDLYVAPEHRRHGIGRRIAAALEEAARARGFGCVYLQVQPERDPHLVRLYERLGYQRLAERPHKDIYAEIDAAGRVHEGEALILDMRKWL